MPEQSQESGKVNARAGSARSAKSAPADALKSLLESYIKTSALQNDYQAAYRSLPTVIEVAGEILKKREESENALDEGLKVVEKVLQDAKDKAETLSADLQHQHDLLQDILQNKRSLTEILKTAKAGLAAAGSDATAAGSAPPFPNGIPGLGPADPKTAYQLNMLTANIQSMVSREVEKQLAQLRAQAEKMMQKPT